MIQEEKGSSIRYQVYALKSNGKLDKPVTYPIATKRTAMKYYTECVQCALVAIDEHGAIVEILLENKTPIYSKKCKTKTVKRQKDKRINI